MLECEYDAEHDVTEAILLPQDLVLEFFEDMDLFEAEGRPCGETALCLSLMFDAFSCIRLAKTSKSVATLHQAVLDWMWVWSDFKDESHISYLQLCFWLDIEPESLRNKIISNPRFPSSLEEIMERYTYFKLHPTKSKRGGGRLPPTPDF